MKPRIAFACFVIFVLQILVNGSLPQAADKDSKVPAFSFANAGYFHRFTQDDQHEYTPAGQEDLNAWTDMVTLLFYPKAKSAEALAATANAVLENYKASKAMVVKTASVPAAPNRPAEHLIVVIFGRPEFIEIAFSRFRMRDGVGSAVVYSHRMYGKKIGDAMNAWLEKNGPSTEMNLMKWDAVPKSLSPGK